MFGLSRKISRSYPLPLERILAVLFVAISISIAAPCRATGIRRLIVEQGHILLAYYHKHLVELKRTSPTDDTLHAYGWLDPAKTKVFVAYHWEEYAAPISLYEIIDLQHRRIIHLDTRHTPPDAGSDTSFAVNPDRGAVLFNRGKGISLLKIDMAKNIYRVYSVNDKIPCWSPFWINDHMGGCVVLSDNSAQFVTFPIPPVSQLHNQPPSYPINLKWTSAHWTVDKMMRLQELPKTTPRH